MDNGYPPEPWDLTGHGYVSLWRVPVELVSELPGGVRPVTVFGKAFVATAFVDYLKGSMLPYHELLAAVLVRRGRRFGITVTQIWVDSERSRTGARELWGIPKEMADFQMTHGEPFRGSAAELAAARVQACRVGVRLPIPLKWDVLHTLNAALASTPVSAIGRLSLASARWRVDPAGPLAWLRPYRPIASLAVTGFQMRFGSARPR